MCVCYSPTSHSSDNFWDSVVFLVDLDTPASIIELLEAKLKRFIADSSPACSS